MPTAHEGTCRCPHPAAHSMWQVPAVAQPEQGERTVATGRPLTPFFCIFHFSPKGRVILFSESLKHMAEDATGLSDVLRGTVREAVEGEG